MRSPVVGFYPEPDGRNFATDPELGVRTFCHEGPWLPVPGGTQRRWPLLEDGLSSVGVVQHTDDGSGPSSSIRLERV